MHLPTPAGVTRVDVRSAAQMHQAVFAALRLAVLRGVDVRILLPSRPDHRMVFAASSLYAAEAVRAVTDVTVPGNIPGRKLSPPLLALH